MSKAKVPVNPCVTCGAEPFEACELNGWQECIREHKITPGDPIPAAFPLDAPQPAPEVLTGREHRLALLREIERCVCRDREEAHGDAAKNFKDTAEFWTTFLGDRLTRPLDTLDVAAMMVLFKSARIKNNKSNLENWVDSGGYSVCGGGIAREGGPGLSS